MSNPIDRLSDALSDRYQIERELGAGGMATVYLAHDVKHNRKVAVKVLRPELAAILGAERFLKEIEVTANLQHPHILPLFDSGEADSFLYYVMPFVEGESLREKLNREKQLSIDEAVRLTTEVAEALHYAHERNIIHRDIKPENILLHSGNAMVADFGIALAVQQASGNRLTETGLSLGTPHYMSPEQATADRELDAKSDIYSLGCVLYEMLTGDPPHTGSTAQAIIASVVTKEPERIIDRRSTVPPHVDAAVHTALQKLPADRFGNADALAEALRTPSYLVGTGGQSRRPASRTAHISWIVTAVVAVIFAAWTWLRTGAAVPGATYRFVIDPPPGHTISTRGIAFPFPAVSPDGRLVAFPADSSGVRRIFVRALDRFESQVVPGTEGAEYAVFSPDGDRLAFYRSQRLFVVPVDADETTQPVLVAEFQSAFLSASGGLTWSDDGAITYGSGLGYAPMMRVPTVGAAAQLLTVPDRDAGEISRNFPEILPGANTMLAGSLSPSGWNVLGVSLDDGTTTIVIPNAEIARYIPDGRLVYAQDGALLVAGFDPRTLQFTTEPVAVSAILVSWHLAGGLVPFFDVSTAGTLVYIDGAPEVSTTILLDRDGTPTVLGDASWNHPAFASDGQSVYTDGRDNAI